MTTAEFQQSVLQHASMSGERVGKPRDITAEYLVSRGNALRTAHDLGVGEQGLSDVRRRLARGYLRRQFLAARFALLDLQFVEKSRQRVWVQFDDQLQSGPVRAGEPPVDVDKRNVACGMIPVYWQRNLQPQAFFAAVDIGAQSRSLALLPARRGRRAHSVTISAVPPHGLTDKHRQRGLAAWAQLYRMQADCLVRGIDLSQELEPAAHYRRHPLSVPQLSVIWAPRLEDLTVSATPVPPRGDPAIVCSFNDDVHVLLDFYDAPDEGPIEVVVREFSEGDFGRL